MEVTVKWFDGQYPSFNVALASKPGNDPFLEVKGCRIVQGKNGEFVSPPSTKNQKTDKYWNHAYFSEDFAAVVLAKAKEGMPQPVAKPDARPVAKAYPFDDDIGF